MNYSKIYNQLIQHRKLNPYNLTQYHEIHHIIPRSLNGSDDEDNLVVLSAREHFIAHLLLEKITKEKYGEYSEQHGKMLSAIFLCQMINNIKQHQDNTK